MKPQRLAIAVTLLLAACSAPETQPAAPNLLDVREHKQIADRVLPNLPPEKADAIRRARQEEDAAQEAYFDAPGVNAGAIVAAKNRLAKAVADAERLLAPYREPAK